MIRFLFFAILIGAFSGCESHKPCVSYTSVEAKSLVNQYRENSVRAEVKWKGVCVEVSGRITSLSLSFTESHAIVVLDGGIITGGVQVELSKESAAQFDEGDRISVKGRVGLYILGRVTLD